MLHPALVLVLLATGAWTLGCGGGGAGSVAPPTPPPPSIQISVTPQSGTVLLGETFAFSATVSNATNTTVTWSVNGVAGGSSQAGLISADGVYTAPADLPQGGTVQVTATSNADSSKFASASVTITSDISVSLSPGTSNLYLGTVQSFHASIASSGRPDTSVRWSLSGPACPNACGSIDGNGNYTAPQVLPNPPTISITATSVADPTKQGSASLSIASGFTMQLAAPASLQSGLTAALVATMTPAPNSNPSSAFSWSLSGTGCSGSSCGVLTVVTTQSSGANPVANTANYTAPSSVPQPNGVTVTVTPQADPSKRVQAVIAIQSNGTGGISLFPATATLAANHRATFSAASSVTPPPALNWSVNGIPGGNASVGMICVAGSNPCQVVTSGAAMQVDFVAPGAIPSLNPVSVSVTSAANPGAAASAQVTILNHVLVSVMPNNVTLSPLTIQSFSASVLGTTNQSVVWQIQGAGCSPSAVCGSIDPFGVYTAPSTPPAPSSFQVLAVSEDDPAQTGSASISISNALSILKLLPSSVYAGAASGFTLQVTGSGFIPSNPGPGSALVAAGTTRLTTCDSANSCSAPLSSSDAANAGNITVQIRNPDNSVSNVVRLVVVMPSATEGVITLTSASPAATGKDLTVVDLTTSGIDTADSNLDLEVAAIGTFVNSSNTCSLAGNPIALQRPASGATAEDICLFSEAGFDTGMSYTVSGPGDVTVIAKQPAGLGIIHLTLQIPATAAPGARTLFIQNANLDRTAASGVLDVR